MIWQNIKQLIAGFRKYGNDPYADKIRVLDTPAGVLDISFTWLDDLFYTEYKDLRDKDDLFIRYSSWAKSIVDGNGGFYIRDRYDGEYTDSEIIKRKGHIIYKVGDIINVVWDTSKYIKKHVEHYGGIVDHIDDGAKNMICKIKLTGIKNLRNSDILNFELI